MNESSLIVKQCHELKSNQLNRSYNQATNDIKSFQQ